jgi:hypothetical protein
VELINEIFSDDNIEVEEKLLVSMELFTSAKLETTDRAKFVGLVSAFEPLAQSEAYGNPELEKLVDNFLNQLNSREYQQGITTGSDSRSEERINFSSNTAYCAGVYSGK